MASTTPSRTRGTFEPRCDARISSDSGVIVFNDARTVALEIGSRWPTQSWPNAVRTSTAGRRCYGITSPPCPMSSLAHNPLLYFYSPVCESIRGPEIRAIGVTACTRVRSSQRIAEIGTGSRQAVIPARIHNHVCSHWHVAGRTSTRGSRLVKIVLFAIEVQWHGTACKGHCLRPSTARCADRDDPYTGRFSQPSCSEETIRFRRPLHGSVHRRNTNHPVEVAASRSPALSRTFVRETTFRGDERAARDTHRTGRSGLSVFLERLQMNRPQFWFWSLTSLDMRRSGTVAAFAAIRGFVPSTGKRIAAIGKILGETRCVTVAAHVIPVLHRACPEQGIVRRDVFLWVRTEPNLSAVFPFASMPGERERGFGLRRYRPGTAGVACNPACMQS